MSTSNRPELNEENLAPGTLETIAAEASQRAIDEAFALGIPITVIKNNNLVRIHPDGTEEVVKQLNIGSKKVGQ